MAYKQKINKLNLALQGHSLRRSFPDSHLIVERSCLTWMMNITPTPLSCTYTVQLRYRLCEPPRVHVLDPPLVVQEGKNPPHTYSENQLCLYLPRAGEWRSDMFLSQTIVPWISEWLLHYEIWRATGKWCGGGIHPKR
jgi:hypothetical protein